MQNICKMDFLQNLWRETKKMRKKYAEKTVDIFWIGLYVKIFF